MNENNNLNSAHLRLKSLRKSLGLTQEKMAELLGISESLYKKNESGRQDISKRTAKAIEKKLGVSAAYMYFGLLRNGDDVWSQILECSDRDKMLFLLKLLRYFFAENNLEVNEEKFNEFFNDIMKIEK